MEEHQIAYWFDSRMDLISFQSVLTCIIHLVSYKVALSLPLTKYDSINMGLFILESPLLYLFRATLTPEEIWPQTRLMMPSPAACPTLRTFNTCKRRVYLILLIPFWVSHSQPVANVTWIIKWPQLIHHLSMRFQARRKLTLSIGHNTQTLRNYTRQLHAIRTTLMTWCDGPTRSCIIELHPNSSSSYSCRGLANNSFTGSLPDGLSNLTSLLHL